MIPVHTDCKQFCLTATVPWILIGQVGQDVVVVFFLPTATLLLLTETDYSYSFLLTLLAVSKAEDMINHE